MTLSHYDRYDYENCESAPCNQMMEELEKKVSSPEYKGVTLSAEGKSFTVQAGDNFEYTDPIDGSVAKKQVILTRMVGELINHDKVL